MILNTAARAAYANAIKLDAQIDARVIRADGSGTPTTAAEFEALKDQAERAWADYREAKDAQANRAERYIVVSDRYANEPCYCTLTEFYEAVADLGWPEPDLNSRSDGSYWENGEMILRAAI